MSNQRFFDFSGVDTVTPENFEGISENSRVCPQFFTEEGIKAFRLIGGWCNAHIDSHFSFKGLAHSGVHRELLAVAREVTNIM